MSTSQSVWIVHDMLKFQMKIFKVKYITVCNKLLTCVHVYNLSYKTVTKAFYVWYFHLESHEYPHWAIEEAWHLTILHGRWYWKIVFSLKALFQSVWHKMMFIMKATVPSCICIKKQTTETSLKTGAVLFVHYLDIYHFLIKCLWADHKLV